MKRHTIPVIFLTLVTAALFGQLPAKAWRDKPAATEQTQRVRLTPELKAGQTLRYQLDFRTTTDMRSEGLAENPQGGGAVELRFSSTVRLDVLAAAPARIRMTYEKAATTVGGSSNDPRLGEVQRQYAGLEGHSVTMTLDAAGKVTAIEGLEDLTPDAKTNAEALEALAKMFTASAPRQGVAIGEKWNDERPVPDAPLVGMMVRSESVYLRNEPCRAPKAGDTPAAGGIEEICAVILTRTQTMQRGTPKDPTPEEYRERGLRTSGRWSGGGESLTYVSLRTGWVVSATQSGSEEMDYTVATADGARKIRTFGKVQTSSNVLVVRDEVGGQK